jgi:hypothetical protein
MVVNQYEERMLCMLMLLPYAPARTWCLSRASRSTIAIVDYYCTLLLARRRATPAGGADAPEMHDASELSLTQKILDGPARLLGRVFSSTIPEPDTAHITVSQHATGCEPSP